ncbi:thiol:disulfide interchange protein DsbG [Pseudomonas sp. R5(2019)]|uniref:thiol:disulfide interchange protein DsbG n=1 Tax=Pseudomonas sp. R5(2019) TaxID=2697566 RepID=UPI001412227C|nr:thiol:disulfide interchange protein DsbG [Pseudomonas sp. R5(2019)]NBA96230.1 thiol:disulfide interchange protein DsbG [Pseudomonas sp. R5(2019)]
MKPLIPLVLGAVLLHTPLLLAEELPAPIKAIEAKGVRILGNFDAPGGLHGYAAQYQGRAMALYLTADGQHVLIGTLLDAKGDDLSQAPLDKLVYAPMAKEWWGKMEQSTWIADGKADAPRIIYLFSDANCPYCNLFWEQARPWVTSGKVQLRHIMVGIIREDSAAKAAAMLASKNPEKTLEQHEKAGKSSGLKPLSKIPDDIGNKLAANLALMEEMGQSATPSIFYLDKAGKLQQQQGAPQPELLGEILGPR